ncbi:MAG: transcription elongation factor GreA [Chloroflexi bacterium]|nr:transcription elongation factor GreA [Chloroflexota bacterium]
MPEDAVLLTKAGYDRLVQELDQLKSIKRPEVAALIREAQELGPDQLDAQYEDAKNQQAFLEGRIAEIERTLEQASIIDEASAHRSKVVQVGSNITVKGSDGKSRKYQLVGPTEADPTQGRISHKSPVGQALLGKKRGDTVNIQTPRGETQFTLTSVS